MAYKALYRTYRPRDFEEIAGQEHITRTFKNALKNNKIAHAYLFSGPRGTGKTSIAKIIAKAVNCIKAPVSNPCNECDICVGINNNTISDVIEIDAASNNGVDEIREIRDKVKYLPGITTYKVYIIDEVHMLSTGAFNALLKTLEEPPKHVIFILATTEPHKIPATIHSRCQRFDFRGVSVPEMINRLNTIIQDENIDIDKEAVKVIAESAEGGMRDAISLLDQVVSYTDLKVHVDDVHAIKGTVSNDKLIKIAQAIKENNSVEAIKLLDELILLGKEPQRLVENLIKFYRDLLVFKNTNVNKEDQLLYQIDEFIDLAKNLSNNIVFFYIEVLNKAQNDMKWTNNAKLYMELALIKMVDKIEKQEIVLDDEINSLKHEINLLQSKLSEIETREPQVLYKEPETKPEVNETEEIIVDEPKEEIVNEPKEEIIEEIEEEEEFVLDPKPKVETKPENDPFSMENSFRTGFDNQKEDTSEETEDENIEESQDDLFTIPALEETKPKEEPYSTFDIRLVERVLNNGDRETKIRINKSWFDLERSVDPLDLQYAKLITSGRLVATDGNLMIIQYPSPSTCNRMMMQEVKQKVVKLLSDFHGLDLDYLALPTEVWEDKMNEFLKKWRENKDQYVQLSKIEHPGLKDIPKINNDVDEFTPDSVKEAMNLFGNDIRIKKGE